MKISAYQLQIILDSRDEYQSYEPVYGDLDYDYGYADDGWPVPPPCPIDGTPMNACKGTDHEANSL